MGRELRSSLPFCLLAALLLPFASPAQEPRLGNEFQVNTYPSNGQVFPSVAAAAGGIFVVAWQSYGQDGSYDGVFIRTVPRDTR